MLDGFVPVTRVSALPPGTMTWVALDRERLLIANVDNDIGESWQWSGTGFVPITASNETFKLGVNYLIYALTH